ncbi:MAG TPA: CoA pyrophosphatase [Gemmatimonadaceae bacterium]|nr:CoA pyrophosphatase [Gemmatimonadaceae bacterium]
MDKLRAEPRVARLIRELESRVAVEVNNPAARRAAVAIVVRLGENDEPEVLFIQRAIYEGDPWSGQIAFPGGREEEGDETLADTAIRETFEEMSIDLGASAELIAALDDLHPQSIHLPSVVVRPFVFLATELSEPVLSDEVADSFWVPLSVLLDRSVWMDARVQAGGFEISRFAFHHRGYVVWGMTERILSGMLQLLSE